MVWTDVTHRLKKEMTAEWQSRALAAVVIAVSEASRHMDPKDMRELEFVLVSCDAIDKMLLTSCTMCVQVRCRRRNRGDGEWECCAVLGG